MFRFVLFAVAACCIATCLSASVDVEQQSGRFLGSMNTYYISTQARFIDGSDNFPVTAPEADSGTEGGDPGTGTDTEDELGFLTGDQPVTVVIHGRESSAFSEMAIALKTSLISSDQDMVVLLLDWAWVSSQPYSQAVSSIMPVAQELSNFIAALEEAGKLDLARLHIVGFDLGAHIAGITSRIAASRAAKITALDPAAEGFGTAGVRLQSTDAGFVEVIHTDCIGNRAYGIYDPIGDLDFYPNGGTRQPGCAAANNLCHHNRSWELFAATVDLNGHLVGLRCATMAEMTSNRCTSIPAAPMGSNTLFKLATGVYRVNTGRVWPYTV